MTFPKRKFGVEIEYHGIPRGNVIAALKAIGVKCVAVIMFAYIRLFVRNMETYKKSEYTMTWGQFIDESCT